MAELTILTFSRLILVFVETGSGPIVSVLTDKFGYRVVPIGGTLVASLGFIVSIFAPNIAFMYFSYGCIAGPSVSQSSQM